MGVGRFTGMSGAWEFLSGAEPQREAPAQGPRFDEATDATPGGAFRVSRHPNNLGPTLIVCLQPTMSVRLLTFAVIGSLYSYFGSILEERRMRAEYQERYDAYRDRTPFFFPIQTRSRQSK
jgi:protein-S-isoprenylcysteine O-methyltransferase Ste14